MGPWLQASTSSKKELPSPCLVLVNPHDIDVVCQYLSPPTLPPCVFPWVRTCGEKTQLSHIDWGPLTHTEKNKAFSSLLRCLGKDLLKVVLHRSTVLSGYRSDIALSKERRGIATEAYINNAEEFAKCVFFFPQERNVLSDCLHTLFCFSFFLWNSGKTERETVVRWHRKEVGSDFGQRLSCFKDLNL